MANSKDAREKAKKHSARNRAKQIPKTPLTLEAKPGQKVSTAYDDFEPEEIEEDETPYVSVPEKPTLYDAFLKKYDQYVAPAVAEAEEEVIGSTEDVLGLNPDGDLDATSIDYDIEQVLISEEEEGSGKESKKAALTPGSAAASSSSNSTTDRTKAEKEKKTEVDEDA